MDIYIPSMNIGIEYNGLYWHSELHKGKNYHLNKYKKLKDIGITLIQIWEDDWFFKKDIVKSRLNNLFGLSNKIYARKCSIREIMKKAF